MNYSELRKYDKSFSLFEKWVERNFETPLAIYNGTIRNEDIVSFLDENKLFVNIKTYDVLAISEIGQLISGLYCTFGLGCTFNGRVQATEAAILKSFEILNDTKTV